MTTPGNEGSVTGKEGPKTVNGKLEAPENTIVSSSAARVVYDRVKHSHRKRCWNYERIDGMLDGNPPYNPAAMQQAGLSDMSNVNWKDGEAVFGSIALSYWSLFNDVENIAEFHIDFGDDEKLKAEWGRILSEEWDRALRSWPSFDKHMSLHQAELIKFGVSALIWPDESSWQFEPVDVRAFLVPDQTQNDIEALTTVLIEQEYSAQFLWKVYENAVDNPDGAWSPEALGEILFQLAHISDEDRKHVSDCRSLQKRIRNGDLFIDALYNDDITLVSVFAKEFDGKISHQMIHHEIDTQDFVYFWDRQYDHMREAIAFFTFRPGQKTIHGNKGLGHSIFSSIEATTQLDCSVLDQAKRAGSLILKGGPNRGRDERQVRFVHGAVIDIGESEIQQNSMGSNVGQTVEVARYFKQKILANNNVGGIDPAFSDRNVQSVRQLELQATKEARIQKNMISHYYGTLDHVIREVVRKMLKATQASKGWEYVKIWKDRCIARGVPEELFDMKKARKGPNGLPDYMDVTASRSAGSGSQLADQIEMKEMMSLLPVMGERGKRHALMDFVAAFRGFRFVPRYFPPEDQTQQPIGDETIASIENNQLVEGKQVIVSPDNNHAAHLPHHVRIMRDFMELYQQDPEAQFDANVNILQKCDEVFSVAGPHAAKHMLFLENDPTRKALFNQLRGEIAILFNFADMIRHNARRQREAEAREQQAQQQALQEQADQNTPAHIKARGEVALKERKLDASIRQEEAKEGFRFLNERTKIRNANVVNRMKAEGELAIKAAKELKDGREE